MYNNYLNNSCMSQYLYDGILINKQKFLFKKNLHLDLHSNVMAFLYLLCFFFVKKLGKLRNLINFMNAHTESLSFCPNNYIMIYDNFRYNLFTQSLMLIPNVAQVVYSRFLNLR